MNFFVIFLSMNNGQYNFELTGLFKDKVVNSVLFNGWLQSMNSDFKIQQIQIDEVNFDKTDNDPIFIKLSTLTTYKNHSIPRILYLIGNKIAVIPLVKVNDQLMAIVEEKPYISVGQVDLIIPQENICKKNITENDARIVLKKHTQVTLPETRIINLFNSLSSVNQTVTTFPSPTDQKLFVFTAFIKEVPSHALIMPLDKILLKSKSVVTKYSITMLKEYLSQFDLRQSDTLFN